MLKKLKKPFNRHANILLKLEIKDKTMERLFYKANGKKGGSKQLRLLILLREKAMISLLHTAVQQIKRYPWNQCHKKPICYHLRIMKSLRNLKTKGRPLKS